MAIKIGNDW